MPKYELNLWDYWRIIRKRRWIIILCVLAVTLSSWFYSKAQTPIYQTSATIKVERRRTIAGVLIAWGGAGTLETEARTVRSHKIVREVANQLGILREGMSVDEINRVVKGLQGKISTERIGNTNLIRITVTSDNPHETVEIANTLTTVYLEENRKSRNRESRSVRDFVVRQLKKYAKALRKSEVKLEKFREGVPAARAAGAGESVALVESSEALSALKKRLVDLQLKLFGLRQTCTEEHPRVVEIKDEIEMLRKQLFTPRSGSQLVRLSRDIELNKDLYIMFRKKLEDANIAMAEQVAEVEVVEPAIEPKSPISPNTTWNVFFGLLMGIILGLVAGVVTETLDTSISTIEDVEEYLKLPVMGVIPYIKLKEEKPDIWKKPLPAEDKQTYELVGRLISIHRPKSTIAEAYRSLQTSIKFTGLDKVGNCFVFTSVGDKEGKTITTTNCALSFAQMGKRVILIDGDLRRPAIHKIFGIKREGGLSEVLTESLKLDEAIKTIEDILLGEIKTREILKTPGMENLSVITAGHLPSNPSQLLNSPQMSSLIKELKERFDVVLFDSAPVLPVTDATILASKVDGVILVYQVGRVARGGLRRAKTQLEHVKATPIGVVLNNIRASEMELGYPYYYYRYYKRYYESEEEEKEKEKGKRKKKV